MIKLLYIDLFCGAGGTSTGIEYARVHGEGTQAEQKKFIGNAVEVNMSRVLCEALCYRLAKENRIAV